MSDKCGTMSVGAGMLGRVETMMTAAGLRLTAWSSDEDEVRIVEGEKSWLPPENMGSDQALPVVSRHMRTSSSKHTVYEERKNKEAR